MNSHYKYMIEQLGERLKGYSTDVQEQGGCFRAIGDEGIPLFFGAIVVDPVMPRLAYLEALPLDAPDERENELLFAINAVNDTLVFGKFYLAPMTCFDGEVRKRIIYENVIPCLSGEVTGGDVEFLIAEGMQTLKTFSVDMLRIIDGSESAADFVNKI